MNINDLGLSATELGVYSAGDTQTEFLAWLKSFSPKLYNKIESKSHLHGFGSDIASVFNSTLNDIKQLAPVYLQTRAQKQILDVQVARAKQGLPPLQTSQLAPTVKVQASISPANMRTLTTQAGRSISTGLGNLKMPLIIGAGIIGAVMFMRKR